MITVGTKTRRTRNTLQVIIVGASPLVRNVCGALVRIVVTPTLTRRVPNVTGIKGNLFWGTLVDESSTFIGDSVEDLSSSRGGR